jgi:DNA-directed RNA polymerase subunit E'/Rpb7
MTDPLYERRELTRNVHVDARFLQRNILASLVAQLRHKYEGVCLPEGYVQPRSITVIEHSFGRTNILKGGLDYSVRFQADLCLPHAGQVFKAPVVLKSKIGLHAEISPIKILLPRDLHIGNADFDGAEIGHDIEFDVVGTRFQQGDQSIVVLGKLREVIRPDQKKGETEEPEAMDLIAAPIEKSDSDKRTVTVAVEKTKPGDVRRKKIGRTVAEGQDEPKQERSVEGKTGPA